MRIAFIYPATEFDTRYHETALPIGLLHLTSVAERFHGTTVDIFDNRHGPERPTAEQLKQYDIIGFTAMSMQVTTALRIARGIRKDGFEGRLIFGGPHASVSTEHLMAQPEIDAVFIGEAEDTFAEYLKYLKGEDHTLSRVWIRDKNQGDEWTFFPGDCFIQDLDSVPIPAREKYEDLIRRTSAINITTTRGCPFNCNYCQPTKVILFGNRVRRRSNQNVVSELQDAIDKYGITRFSIDDDTFTFHKKSVMEFCEMVKPLGLYWSCQSRTDIDREILKAMKDSGHEMLFVGAESGSQRMLELMDKRNKVENNLEFIDTCNELGIFTWCNMMVGYPGETRKDMQMSLDFVRRAKPNRVCVSQVTQFPGTRLWSENKDDVIPLDWNDVARHVSIPKFRSMAGLQSVIRYYQLMMSKEGDLPLNAELLNLSPRMEKICRRFPGIAEMLLRRKTRGFKKITHALELARSGNVDQAINQLENLKKHSAGLKEILGNLAWLYLQTERPKLAAENYASLLKKDPDNIECRLLLAQSLVLIGKLGEAKSHLEEILHFAPTHERALKAMQELASLERLAG